MIDPLSCGIANFCNAMRDTVTPSVDCDFDDAPLILAVAQISFTESPELLNAIASVKSSLGELGLPIAQSKNQTNFTVDQNSPTPKVTHRVFWWFTGMDKKQAVVIAQNSIVVYEASYENFELFKVLLRQVLDVVAANAGDGCFTTSAALRYVSGFPSDGTPSSYLVDTIHGLSLDGLNTDHWHHHYNFWCATEIGGKLVVNCKTVHGNQLVPKDVLSTDLALNAKFSLSREVDAVQLDIHETIQKKTLGKFDPANIERDIEEMRKNIKQAFLNLTSRKAHETWSIKTKAH